MNKSLATAAAAAAFAFSLAIPALAQPAASTAAAAAAPAAAAASTSGTQGRRGGRRGGGNAEPMYHAQTAADPIVRHDPEGMPLWAKGAPGSEGHNEPELWSWRIEPGLKFPVVSRINQPSITAFLPDKTKATGAAVIIAPGGGHFFHSIDHEGYDVGKYFQSIGVAGFVLKYRLARETGSPYKIEDAVADGQRAVRMVRSRAAEWGVDPARIGIFGFSAGGEVAAKTATLPSEGKADAADPIEKVSSRPDFLILAYPGVQPDTLAVTETTPPAFFFAAFNDGRQAQTLPALMQKFKTAGVTAELHIFSDGGHGFGIRPGPLEVAEWPHSVSEWMRDMKLLSPAAKTAEKTDGPSPPAKQ